MISIVFVSNYLNHHVLPLCNYFTNRIDVSFKFIAAKKTPAERLSLGYSDMNSSYDFVVKAYDKKGGLNDKEILKEINEADILIVGGVWGSFLRTRYHQNGLNFRVTESFTKGRSSLLKRIAKKIKYFYLSRKERNFYLLCCGEQASQDYNYKSYKNKHLRFGYFPSIPPSSLVNSQKNKDNKKLLWVGRMIEWKHPEYLIRLADKLKTIDDNLCIDVIGGGPLFKKYNDLVNQKQLDNIIFHGPMPYYEIEKYYWGSSFFLFTSDTNEGWGAVLNEAMSCYCVPIASKLAGSTSFLAKANNSFVFDGTYLDFEKKVISALNLKNEQIYEMQKKAFETISLLWNADVVGERFMRFLNCKLDRKELFKDGPLSFII